MLVTGTTRIDWTTNAETQFPFGRTSPDPQRWQPLGFPPPWPDRPWIYGVMVCSANGVVAWRRRDHTDDPVRSVLGGDDRPGRIADRRHMRFLRSFGDVAVGAQTVREQPDLVLTPQEPRDEPVPELYGFRVAHGLPRHPRNIVYSLLGRLPLAHPMFTRPELDTIVVTSEPGAAEIRRRAGGHATPSLVVEPRLDAAGLRRAHERLFADRGVRYLACEGGETVLAALREASLLDEVFLTVTDVTVDERAHDGVLKIMDFAAAGATLIAEGRTVVDPRWRFQRWRFSDR